MRSTDAKCHIDACQRILSWKRLCTWACYDFKDETACIIVFRSPKDLKQQIVSNFRGHQACLLPAHPMLIHAVIAEDVLIKTYDFLEKFSEPVYASVSL